MLSTASATITVARGRAASPKEDVPTLQAAHKWDQSSGALSMPRDVLSSTNRLIPESGS